MMTVRIAAFYKFFRFPDYSERRQALAQCFCALGIKGTLLLAEEGVNGAIAGVPDAITGSQGARAAAGAAACGNNRTGYSTSALGPTAPSHQ